MTRGVEKAIAVQSVVDWLRKEVARSLNIPVEDVEPRARFQSYGLDSTRVTALIARLGTWLERPLPVTLAWECPTIDALARHVGSDGARASDRGASSVAERSERRVEQARVVASSTSEDEPIAIIGIGCRFPGGADSPSAFWRLLREGVDAITDVPPSRREIQSELDDSSKKTKPLRGGFVENIDRFDALFFGISPREALELDPQQRLMLELSWEALEDAAIVPDALRGSRTGVFFGAMWTDYARLASGDLAQIVQHTATGQDTSIIAARVSYTLGLEGPSLVVNTACSSSLVAVHLACQSLRSGESAIAMAGGVNLILAPHSMVTMSRFGAMAPDGRCKAFDARANGYVRGEGGGVVVLKPLSRALADGDSIYCVIRGGAINNDGFSNGLTAPNPKAQEAVLRDAYAQAGVEPTKVHYIETHGTGTVLGDPIEAGALGAVLGAGRTAGQPLRIGSVKTNIGHTESAAGIAGLIKVALSMKNRALPPSLHFEKPNPHIPFDALRLAVQRTLAPWPAAGEPLVAGVSSFGFGGTNCHVVLQSQPESTARVIPLSAGDPAELGARVFELMSAAAEASEPSAFEELFRSAAHGAGRGRHRLAVVARSGADLFDRLTSWLRQGGARKSASSPIPERQPRIVFVCSGHGAQWLGMGRTLLRSEPVFRAKIEACDRVIRGFTGWSVLDELAASPHSSRLNRADVVQPLVFSMQVALGALWMSWGIDPDAVIGHSSGEVAACHLAGILSLEDAARVICLRSRLAVEDGGRGGMLLVPLPSEKVLEAISGTADALSIASYNSPSSTTLSGELALIEAAQRRFAEMGVDAARINVDYASHCPLMDPLAPRLMAVLEGIKPRRARIRMVSTVEARDLLGPECGPDYWARNLRQSVRFQQVVETILEEGETIFVELSPHPILSRSIDETIASRRGPATTLSSCRRNSDERVEMLESLAALYTRGANVPFQRLFPTNTTVTPPEVVPQASSEDQPTRATSERAFELLVLSARSTGALRALAERMTEHLETSNAPSLADICFTAATRRAHHEHRLTATGRSHAEIATLLQAFVRGERPAGLCSGQRRTAESPKLVFVFPGQGSQWVGMGRELLDQEPAFREAIEVCDEAIQREAGFSVLEELRAEESQSRLDRIDVIQPVLFALEVALAALWRSWGVEPDAVVGHSMGEIAAAYVVGALRLEDAVRIICRRSRIMRRISGQGALAQVELTLDEAEQALRGFESRLSVAASNGPRTTILSGDPAALEEVLSRLEAADVFCRRVKVDIAAHSPQLDPFLEELRASVRDVSPRAANVPMLSTVTGERLFGPELSADYWLQNFRQPVLFSQATRRLIDEGHALFVEMSPHPILLPSIEENLREKQRRGAALGSLRRQTEERRTLLESLGTLYAQGHAVPLERLYPSGGRVVSLPSYPWERKRYWPEAREVAREPSVAASSALEGHAHPFLHRHVRGAEQGPSYWEGNLSLERLPYLADHKVGGIVVVPGTAYLEMILSAASDAFGDGPCTLSDVRFLRAMFLSPGEERILQVQFSPKETASAAFRIYSRASSDKSQDWTLHVTGDVSRGDALAKSTPRLDLGATDALRPEDFYARLRAAGVGYGPMFQAIQALGQRGMDVVGHVVLPDALAPDAERYRFHPALFDACLQVQATPLTVEHDGVRQDSPFMPTHLQRLDVYARPGSRLHCHVALREGARAGSSGEHRIVGDLRILEEGGQTIAEASGLVFQLLDHQDEALSSDDASDWLYELDWEEASNAGAPDAGGAPSGTWIVFTPGEAPIDAAALAPPGVRCLLVEPGASFARVTDDRYTVNPREPADFVRLFEAVRERASVSGVLHLWSVTGGGGDMLSPADLESAEARGCLSVLYLLRALGGAGGPSAPKLWIVTRGSQHVKMGDEVPGLTGAPLWGLGKTISVEDPTLWGGLIDLDPHGASTREAEALWQVVSGKSPEDHLAFRGGKTYVARIARRARRGAAAPFQPRTDVSYLITGGLGDLGLTIARWLAIRGARHLVLMGRTGLPAREAWRDAPPDSAAGRRIAAILEIERLGAGVHVVEADVSDATALTKAIASYEGACRPPICGVIHAAGVMKQCPLAETDADALSEHLRPKVQGTYNLHRALSDRPLDFFVSFSSGSSLLGSPLLGAYAAANSFLDALAHHRRARGLAATSINWGFWAEVGMAARAVSAASNGMRSFTPQQGTDLLGRLIAEAPSQVGVLRVQWDAWFAHHAGMSHSPLLAKLRTQSLTRHEPTVAAEAPRDLRSELLEIAPEQRIARVEEHVAAEVSTVLRLPAAELAREAPFGGMGLDSLMAVEVRNRLATSLGVTLSVTALWNYPNVRALSRFLLERIVAEAPEKRPGANVDRPGAPAKPSPESIAKDSSAAAISGALGSVSAWIVQELDSMSDAEAEALLNQELDALELG